MFNPYNLITRESIISTIFVSLTFFLKIIIYRSLYEVIKSSENFHLELTKNILLTLTIELLYNYSYYKSKIAINKFISNIFKKITSNMILCNNSKLSNYDKSKLLSINDNNYIFESVYEKLIILLPKNILYLCYYFYIIYEFSFNVLIMMLVTSLLTTYVIHQLSIKKELNYGKLYKLESNLKQSHIERLNNLNFIKTSQSESFEITNITQSYDERSFKKIYDLKMTTLINLTPEITGLLMTYIIYILGYKQMDLLDLMFLAGNSINFTSSIINLKSIYDDYSKHYEQLKLVSDFITIEHEDTNLIKYKPNINKIKINDIILEKQKLNTIIGKNGCGKTTMIYSLLNLNDFKNYTISYENNSSFEIMNYPKDHICFVFQDPYLFDKSVEYNITYGVSTIDHFKITKLSEEIGLKEWYMLNHNKSVGFGGDKISGGEKKKIQLMNALLQDKDIYIFDEPTNNLDNNTKKWYLEQIKKMSHEKLIIVISHDDFIINNSDLIIDFMNFSNRN